jgi:catechol 2,3-dioxygenase-like lactoylglutathione lyase family enzyme
MAEPPKGHAVKIHLASVFVDDQRAALDFYTNVLGFEVRHDIEVGDGAWWLTVVSPDDPDGAQLLLEPAGHPAVQPYRDAIVEDGIPLAQFLVDDVQAEYDRLTERGVTFTQPPTDLGELVMAVFDDTCGNLIQIVDRG